MSRQYIFIIVIIVLVVVGVLAYFLTMGGENGSDVISPENGKQATTTEDALPPLLEEVGAGDVGEVLVEDEATGEEKPLITPEMPVRITSTTGRIVSVKDNALVMMGGGYNFSDGIARELTGLFTDKTITVAKDGSLYLGLLGLNVLQKDMDVLVGADENIRGKTEFEVKTIKILK